NVPDISRSIARLGGSVNPCTIFHKHPSVAKYIIRMLAASSYAPIFTISSSCLLGLTGDQTQCYHRHQGEAIEHRVSDGLRAERRDGHSRSLNPLTAHPDCS